MKYFSDDEYELRQLLKKHANSRLETELSLKKAKSELSDFQKNIDKEKRLIQSYQNFDLGENESREVQLLDEISSLRLELIQLQKRSGELNKRIKPELEKLKELEKGIESFERKISLAQDYENELSNASNSYERAMAHQDCENELGFSKPRQAVSSFQRKVSSLKRNKTKLEKKINELTRRKLRDIKHLVWDGSNLCYCGDEFIGLSALIPLTENTSKN